MLSILLTSALGAPRIADGAPADDLPEVVAFSDPYLTSGILIHPQVVLTHAHLFDSLDVSAGQGQARVFVGGDIGWLGTEVPATAIAVHPDYQSVGYSPNAVSESDGPARNDVALVWLAEPIELPVMALNESPLTQDWAGATVEIAGFGVLGDDITGGGVRRRGITRIDAIDDQAAYLFDPDGPFPCVSDAGGPVLRYSGDRPVALGITWSYGEDGCGVTPSTHGRVDVYLDWIRATIAPLEIETVALDLPSLSCAVLADDPSGEGVVGCEVTVSDGAPITQVRWSWGDASTDTTIEPDVAHAYDDAGTYTVEACVTTLHRDSELEACVRADQVVAPFGEEVGGCGCAHSRSASTAWMVAPLLMLIARR